MRGAAEARRRPDFQSEFLVFACRRCSIRVSGGCRLSLGFDEIGFPSARPPIGFLRVLCFVFAGALGWSGFPEFAKAADPDGDDAAKAASTLPNIYLDLRTIYSRVPANSLSIGFSNPSSLSSAIATLQMLSTLPGLPSGHRFTSEGDRSAHDRLAPHRSP